ncbi:hypothetical protein D9613_004412 [Agrocybe pediades]|uniref:Transcription termination and cleavage factor C-terminal domain-containing protein n=1 Tax=Agrocybe pediades TaxID=84607 RepID=A0A8H4VJR5_9AGAR|nr:hypothetical protein D9613_004412 [Agrocybe pediades]
MANPGAATEQLLELLLTLKKTTPTAAKSILNSQPAIAYALISLMVQMNAINVEVFQKTLEAAGTVPAPTAAAPAVAPQPVPTVAPTPMSSIPPHIQAQYRTSTPPSIPTHTPTPPYGYNAPTPIANGPPHAPTPPLQGGYPQYPPQSYPGYQQQQHPAYQQQQHQYPQQPAYQHPGYGPYGGGQHQPPSVNPTPAPTLPDTLANIPDDQKALIMRVLSMTPEQINMLPPQDRATYIQIRATLGVPTG